jgi:hypothetical protein
VTVTPIRKSAREVFGTCRACDIPLTPEWKSPTEGLCEACDCLADIEQMTERTKRLIERMERQDGDGQP